MNQILIIQKYLSEIKNWHINTIYLKKIFKLNLKNRKKINLITDSVQKIIKKNIILYNNIEFTINNNIKFINNEILINLYNIIILIFGEIIHKIILILFSFCPFQYK